MDDMSELAPSWSGAPSRGGAVMEWLAVKGWRRSSGAPSRDGAVIGRRAICVVGTASGFRELTQNETIHKGDIACSAPRQDLDLSLRNNSHTCKTMAGGVAWEECNSYRALPNPPRPLGHRRETPPPFACEPLVMFRFLEYHYYYYYRYYQSYFKGCSGRTRPTQNVPYTPDTP